VVEPRRIEVLDSTTTRSLTLVTCYPFAFVGHAPQRFVVRARQVVEETAGPRNESGGTASSARRL
jgi:sortase (surface protein transpeptidase)